MYKSKKNLKLKGYIFSRSFLEERVPQSVQNLVIRDYCQRNQCKFQLSETEYSFKNSYLILESLIKKLNKNIDGLVFYSLFQLPEKKNKRENFYKSFLKKNIQVHFALENIKAIKKSDFASIEKLFLLRFALYEKKNIKKKLGRLKNFVSFKHNSQKREYLDRMSNGKIQAMKVSKKYDFDYWDGNRKFGYGGYKYIPGYHTYLAKKLISDYQLNGESKILDVGCGKGYLMYELKKLLNLKKIQGCDFSRYAIKNAKPEIKKNIFFHDIKKKLKFEDNSFDLVISINVLHNLKLPILQKTLSNIEKIGKKKFICVESYRNEAEQFNLQCWALTAETIIDTSSWKWLFYNSGYTGDFEFIYFK